MESKVMCNTNVRILVEKEGQVIKEIEKCNLTVNAGMDLIRDLLNGDAVDPLTHFAVGTDDTAASSGDTTLGTEVFRDTFTQTTEDPKQLEIRYYLGSGDANGNTLKEVGLFNAASGGTMYARAVHTGIVKDTSVAITYVWTLTWSAVT